MHSRFFQRVVSKRGTPAKFLKIVSIKASVPLLVFSLQNPTFRQLFNVYILWGRHIPPMESKHELSSEFLVPKAYFAFSLQLEKTGAKVLYKMNIKEDLQITVCNYSICERNISSSFFFSTSVSSKRSSKAELAKAAIKWWEQDQGIAYANILI